MQAIQYNETDLPGTMTASVLSASAPNIYVQVTKKSERQSPHREEVRVDEFVNKTSVCFANLN